MINYLAMIAAWVGDKDLACEQLAIAISGPSNLGYGELKLSPFWDPLRGDPRFKTKSVTPFLVEFNSALEAAQCAIEIQRAWPNATAMCLTIGELN